MRVDAAVLDPIDRVSQGGVRRAARSLERLAGIPASVGSATIEIAPVEDVTSALRGRELVGVRVPFEGALRGVAVLVFEPGSARALASQLPGTVAQDEVPSRMTEIGNILLSGFLDEWADRLSAEIDQRPPVYVREDGAQLVPDRSDRTGTLTVRDLFDAPSNLDVSVHLFTDRRSFGQVLAPRDGRPAPITVERLRAFDRLSASGVASVSDRVTAMTGVPSRLDRRGHRLVPVHRLPDDERLGITVELNDGGAGHLAILFDEEAAATVAALLGTGPIDGPFDAMQRSAVEEFGNVMVSGFVDGWADVLGTCVLHSPPTFVRDGIATIVARLSTRRPYAIELDSVIEIGDASARCDVIALPNAEELSDVFVGTAAVEGARPPDVDEL